MERIIYKIVLNVAGKNAYHALSAKQYDNGARLVQAVITNNGTPICIRATDTIMANFYRPKFSTDEKQSDYSRAVMCELVDGDNGIVQFPMDYWAVERSGELSVDVSILTDSNPPERLTTAAFTVTVFPATNYTSESLAGESYDALLDIFGSVSAYKQEITSMAMDVVNTSVANEARRESEYSALKIHMEGVVNEAEVCERNAAASLSEVRLAVSDFKAWYDRLPEKGITIGEHYIDFTKLTTFKTTVNIDPTPTEPTHAVNKRYVDSFVPDRAMNAYRLNDTYGSVILYEEAYGVKVQSHAGGNWNDGIYVVSTSKENNSYSTVTCGDAEKRNLVSLVCCAVNGTRHIDLVKDGVYHAIEFPFKDGEFALTSDLEPYLLKDGIVNGADFVDFHKHVTFKSTVNIDIDPVEHQQAANKGYVDSVAEGKLSKNGIVNGDNFVDFNKQVTFKSTVNIDVAPVERQHATNKGYVDDCLAAKVNSSALATVATSGSYTDLANKPSIPNVYNGKLTLQKNGSTVATFNANSSTNVTANIVVPTKLSELTNDMGYVTSVVSAGGTQFRSSHFEEDIGTVYVATDSDDAYPSSINGSNASAGYYDPEVYLNPGNQKLYAFNAVECVDFYKYYDYAYLAADRKYAVIQFYGRFEIRITSYYGGKYSGSTTQDTYTCINPVLVSRDNCGTYCFDIYYTDESGWSQKILQSENSSMQLSGIEIRRLREADNDYSYAVMVKYKRLGGSIY